MNTEIKPFDFEGTEVRMIMRDGEPWWVAKDICTILSHSNPTMALSELDADERAKLNLGRQGDTNIINESGLYSLILRSRKPEAKRFKKWVTREVLPSIRKTGRYVSRHQLAESGPKTLEEWKAEHNLITLAEFAQLEDIRHSEQALARKLLQANVLEGMDDFGRWRPTWEFQRNGCFQRVNVFLEGHDGMSNDYWYCVTEQGRWMLAGIVRCTQLPQPQTQATLPEPYDPRLVVDILQEVGKPLTRRRLAGRCVDAGGMCLRTAYRLIRKASDEGWIKELPSRHSSRQRFVAKL